MFTSARDAATEYLSRGWAPIPIPWREKNPGRGEWQKLRVTPETLGRYFDGARQNIGVVLGEASGNLIDTDLDCREALITADYFLPDTGSRFGRAGMPDSHRLFISDCPFKQFVDPVASDKKEAMIIELRSTGHHTVFPPSVHKETGELIEWVCDTGPAEIDGVDLTRRGGLIASSALIARYWPNHARHETSLALAGALRHSGWELEQVEIFVKAVVDAAGDEEITDRVRAARDTFAKEAPTTGWPTLAKLLGRELVAQVREWLVVSGRVEEEWPEPGHISQVLLPVPAFDPDVLLPEALRGWIVDQAEGMPCPVEFVAVPAIVSAGSVIGARCAIRPKVHSHWVAIPNVWGGDVGAPGTKKSPAAYAGLQPLGHLMKDARAACAEARRDSDSQEDGLEEAPEVTEKRYMTNDSTVEKLADLLIENPAGLLVERDELVGLIASWDMKGHEQSRAFYLEGWNGYRGKWVDRIKRGSSWVPNVCLSVFGGIQPAKLAAYLNQAQDALADDGMLQRFQMLVYPDPIRWANVDRAPSLVSLKRAYGVFKALDEMVPIHWGAAKHDFIKFPYFVFEEQAQAVFNDWLTELNLDRIPAEENPLLVQWLNKADNLFLGLSLIFHLVDIADTQIPRPGETLVHAFRVPERAAWVSLGATRRAAAWCSYLEAHARRIYGMIAPPELRAAQVLAPKVRAGKLKDGFTVRDVIRARWHGLTTPEEVHAALAWLEEEGWVRGGFDSAGPKGGRPTTRYRINPRVQSDARCQNPIP